MFSNLSKKAAAVVATAAVAQGLHLPSPNNSYYGDLRSTLTCTALDLVNLTIDAYVAALAPLTIQSGQQTYFNDVAANLSVPAAISTALGLAVDHVDTRVFIYLDVPNLTPNPLNTLPDGVWLNGSKFSLLQDTNLVFPPDPSGVIQHIGPVTAGEAGTQGSVTVHQAIAELYLYGGLGELIKEITLTCNRPEYAALLANFNIVPAIEENPPLLDAANGYLVDYPQLDEQEKFICINYEYDCAIGSNAALPFEVSTCGRAGSFYSVGEEFAVTDSTTEVTITADQVSMLKTMYPGLASIDYTADTSYIFAKNAQPESLMQAGDYQNTFTVPSSGDFVFDLPSNFGSFTAGNAPGDTVYLGPVNTTSQVVFRDNAGKSLDSAEVVCKTRYQDLVGTRVSIVPVGAELIPGLTGI